MSTPYWVSQHPRSFTAPAPGLHRYGLFWSSVESMRPPPVTWLALFRPTANPIGWNSPGVTIGKRSVPVPPVSVSSGSLGVGRVAGPVGESASQAITVSAAAPSAIRRASDHSDTTSVRA